MSPQTISLAYSSDSDDAFMVAPLRQKLVGAADLSFRFYAQDIQKLNELATQGTYDVTAISAAAYPALRHLYEMVPFGASFATVDGGPALVVPTESCAQSLADVSGQTLLLPGAQTSAAATAAMLIPDFVPRYAPFHLIAEGVRKGDGGGGILIHERQMSLPAGLRILGHLGAYWAERFPGCALPLGLIVVKRNLAPHVKKDVLRLYLASIDYALCHRDEILKPIHKEVAPYLSYAEATQYIERYVSLRSILSYEESLQVWYEEGFRKGLWPARVALKEDVIAWSFSSCKS